MRVATRIGPAALAALAAVGIARAEEEARSVEPGRRVTLVELYTSQGCNYCPTAERLLESMNRDGTYGDRVVTLAFHVDYFNTPWADPFSERLYSGRQWAYHRAAKRRDAEAEDLYFTPMIMVDGRYPMSGWHKDGIRPVQPHLKARLDRALKNRPEATLRLEVAAPSDAPDRRVATVAAGAAVPAVEGRPVLVGLAIAEGPLTTEVPSGENAGASLVERHVVRRLLSEEVTLDRGEPAEARFDLELGEGWDPGRCEVVAFLQDEQTGAILQAAALPWAAPAEGVPDGR